MPFSLGTTRKRRKDKLTSKLTDETPSDNHNLEICMNIIVSKKILTKEFS